MNTPTSPEKLLRLPEQYDLVVGDTFELFFKGIALCLSTDVFAFELCFSDGKSRGNNYTKKYVWTPAEEDIGVHSLSITVRDNFGRVLDTGTVKMNVVDKPVSPEKERTYLFVGASNNSLGKWSGEVFRRLTASTDTPVSCADTKAVKTMCDGLKNIKCIGTKKKDLGYCDFYYEGYGGWSFVSYTNPCNRLPYFVYVNGEYASLKLSQHSFYKDKNDQIWKLETITDTCLKLIAVDSVGGGVDFRCKGLNIKDGEIPASGTLTLLASGGVDDAEEISYSATAFAEGNPFWSVQKERNDFRAYAEKHGVEKIDEIIVNLGWNSQHAPVDVFAQSARDFLDSVLADFPECHISLVSLAVPSRDGIGTNYGTSWSYFDKTAKMFDFQQAIIDISNEEKYSNSVSVVSVVGQIDTENAYLTKTFATNNRVPNEIIMQSNGLHFNDSGYYQQGDAIYRHVVTRLQKNGCNAH